MTDSVAHDLAPTGPLRVSINLGNPVLAQGTHDDPRGVTVDLARQVADRLGLDLELQCFDAARDSYAALADGRADLCFLAVDPAREEAVAFTAPYVVIEGVYAVPDDSPLRSAADVDAAGVRVGVKQGSAYDLFLTRELSAATVVRGSGGADGVAVFLEEGLEVAAGIRHPVETFVAEHGAMRVLEPRFMEIKQAIGVPRTREPATLAWLHALVEELKADGTVAGSLRRSGRVDATLAPPA